MVDSKAMILLRWLAVGYRKDRARSRTQKKPERLEEPRGWFREKPDTEPARTTANRPKATAMQTHRLNKTALAIMIVVVGWASLWSQTSGAPGGNVPLNTERLEVVSSQLPSGIQQIVVVDSQNRSMAIYHIEPNQGKLVLRSVRNLTWDLSMEQFNGQAPLPSDLRQARP